MLEIQEWLCLDESNGIVIQRFRLGFYVVLKSRRDRHAYGVGASISVAFDYAIGTWKRERGME